MQGPQPGGAQHQQAPAGPAGDRPPQAGQPQGAAGQQGGALGGAPVNGAPQGGAGLSAGPAQMGPVRPRGVLQEIQALVIGFFTSLMPGA